MFNLLSKKKINSIDRLEFILDHIIKQGESTTRTELLNLSTFNLGVSILKKDSHNVLSDEEIKRIIATISALKFGFGILALNFTLSKEKDFRNIVIDTLNKWQINISHPRGTFSNVLSTEIRKEIGDKFLETNLLYDIILGSKSKAEEWKYFKLSFLDYAVWYSEKYTLVKDEKFYSLVSKHFEDSFIFFWKTFSKFNHTI